MCRNIRVLYSFQPPTTAGEVREAALQYVRKVSGLAKPPQADTPAFDTAEGEITRATEQLLAALTPRPQPRSREGERDKARTKWKMREASATEQVRGPR